MKYATTKKNVLARYGADNIICVGYADLQNLLRFESAEAYTSGTYGWNADIYGFDGVAICTGYRPFGNIRPSRDLVERFERLAREELEAPYPRSWKITESNLHKLAQQFVRLAISE